MTAQSGQPAPRRFERSRGLIDENARFTAGGVNSHFRTGMAEGPLVFSHGDGARLIDADGNTLIDYYCGMGATILGHTPPEVIAAARAQVEKGILFAGQTEIEIAAARLLCDRIPCAERVRFGCSGSEVMQAALRVARAATGRRMILKCEGHYHGWMDNVLWSTAPALNAAGPSDAPVPVAGSAGQSDAQSAEIAVIGWNDLAALEARLAAGNIAAVIMEPAMCNQGAIAPEPGYLEGVREACTRTGTLLVFDEVITGFRLDRRGAQSLFGVTPDLAIFAKAIANGFPVAALCGRADLMDLLARGGVMHGGTFNAQPVSMAAMMATQTTLTPELFNTACTRGLRLQDGVRKALDRAGLQAVVAGFPLVFHVAFGRDAPARDYRDIAASDRSGYTRFAHALLRRGVRALERGAWFVSTAHDDATIDETIAIVEEAARETAAP
ncbi:MAG: aminotransferase class III-fold pyridoxal phosphate-dependent enzyme [Salinarimonas sp.]|nr:aminotransferase class III-fold pyridoxal phosphate-dependent enzyme [Salinarimonas sp.]